MEEQKKQISKSFTINSRPVTVPIINTPGASKFCWWCNKDLSSSENTTIVLANGTEEGSFCNNSCSIAFIRDKINSSETAKKYKTALQILISKNGSVPPESLPWQTLEEYGGSLTRKQYVKASQKCYCIRTEENLVLFDIEANSALGLKVLDCNIYSQ